MNIRFHGMQEDRTSDDDAGEAYYQLEGTDKKFQVRLSGRNQYSLDVKLDGLSTHDAPQGATIRVGFLGRGQGTVWILYGDEDMGYWTGDNPPKNWMSSYRSLLGPRKLKHICMPGSHDAGMSKLGTNSIWANEANTKTQNINIYQQLERGSRFFDIRPAYDKDGKYYTGHFGKVIDRIQGAEGESIDDIIDHVNR
jgi:hypothetical protein